MGAEKRTAIGKVTKVINYLNPSWRLNKNIEIEKYCYGNYLSLSKMLKDLENRKVKITIETIGDAKK